MPSDTSRKFKTYALRIVLRSHPLPIEQKAHTLWMLALAFTECIHEFLERCRSLDLKEDFVIIVGDLDVEVFWLRLGFVGLARVIGGRSFVGHCRRWVRCELWRRGVLPTSERST